EPFALFAGGVGIPIEEWAHRGDECRRMELALQPEISVVDELDVTAGEFHAAHAAGITTALTGIPNGIFRGQSALINLDGDSVSRMIVRAGISQNIGFARGGGGAFGGGRGGYPGTLFGVFAS